MNLATRLVASLLTVGDPGHLLGALVLSTVMPFMPGPSGNVVLLCINHHTMPGHVEAVQNGTTMRAGSEWIGMNPVTQHRLTSTGGPTMTAASLNQRAVQVFRCFVCSVCGYSELYDAVTIDPSTWSNIPPALEGR